MRKAAKRVAVLGAGPGGLVAAKELCGAGLKVTVFEASQEIGGVWASGTWDTMRTNLSSRSCAFSDFPWRPAAPAFPTAAMVREYLHQYAEHFRLLPLIEFGARASLRHQPASSAWTVIVNGEREESFDCVCVAVGFFSEPASLPDAVAKAVRSADCLHTKDYRSAGQLAPGTSSRVLVVGGAFSGAEVAADLAAAGLPVTCSVRTAHYYLPRFVKRVPVDLALYRVGGVPAGPVPLDQQHRKLEKLARRPLPIELQKSPRVAISDDFVQMLEERRIDLQDELLGVRRTGSEGYLATFANGEEVLFSQMVAASGYRATDLSKLFEQDVLRVLDFDEDDSLQPVILCHQTWHPGQSSLGFVGFYRGPYFATMELQARLLASLWAGRGAKSQGEEENEAEEEEDNGDKRALHAARNVRTGRMAGGRPQFPNQFVEHATALSDVLGVRPPAFLTGAPLVPSCFRVCGPDARPLLAMACVVEAWLWVQTGHWSSVLRWLADGMRFALRCLAYMLARQQPR